MIYHPQNTPSEIVVMKMASPNKNAFDILIKSVMVLLLCMSLPEILIAQSTSFPGWATSLTRRDAFKSYLPPEYSGTSSGFARSFITVLTPKLHSKTWKLQGTVNSGTLAFWDHRSTPNTKSGIATGLSRVYGLRLIESASPGSHEVLVTGWDAVTQRSAVKRVVIPPSGAPSVLAFGPPPPAGQIWVNSGMVNGTLYVLDLNTLTILRFLDNDDDGDPETLDAGFAFSLASVPTATSFSTFAPTSSGIVALRGRSPASVTRVLKNSSSGLILTTVTDNPPVQLLRITGPLYVNQRRIRVRGAPSKSFRIRETTGGAPAPGWVSNTFALPRSGHMIIDLNVSLQAGWKLEIVASDMQQPVGPPAKVSSNSLVALFEPLDRECNQGAVVRFEGDGLRNIYEARCMLNGSIVPLTTGYVSGTQIDITMPPWGDTSKKPPYTGSRPLRIWLVDTTTSVVVSETLDVNLLFAP